MRWLALVALVCGCGSAPTTSPPTAAPVVPPTAAGESRPAAPPPGTVANATFHSEALGVDKRYYVYLPAGYEHSDKRYPVVYMLHGLGGSEDNWTKHMGLTAAADALGMQAIAVMPDGDDSFYANWATEVSYQACREGPPPFGRNIDLASYCVERANYEDYVVADLVAHIDATYRTVPTREARAIGGLSMGGFGALMLGMRHPDVFSSVASHSGVATLMYKGPYPYQRGKVELSEDPNAWIAQAGEVGALFARVFGRDGDHWRAHDPAQLARSLENGALALYIDCGTEDEFELQHGAAYLHEVLEERHIEHVFELLPGRHIPAFWQQRIDDSLGFHIAQFRKAGVYPD